MLGGRNQDDQEKLLISDKGHIIWFWGGVKNVECIFAGATFNSEVEREDHFLKDDVINLYKYPSRIQDDQEKLLISDNMDGSQTLTRMLKSTKGCQIKIVSTR